MSNPSLRAVGPAVALVLVIASSVAAQERPRKPDRERDDLYGPVKAVNVATSVPGDASKFEPVEDSTYSENGALVGRSSYVDGRLAAKTTFGPDEPTGRPVATTSLVGMGFGVRTTRLQPRDETVMPKPSAGGTYAFRDFRVFDTAGRLINEAIMNGDDPKAMPLSRIIYRYDPKGRMAERTRSYGSQGAIVDREVFTYDEHDHVSESLRYRQGNLLPTKRTYSYTYDERGNWTKRTATEQLGGVATSVVTTRTISYY